jgi:transposase
MLFFLDELLNFPNITVRSYKMEEQSITIKLDFIKETVCCIDCEKETNNINQIRKVKIRDMPIQGKITVLEMGRRQYYCENCQHYFTEKLDFIDFPRNITERYKKYIYERIKASTITQIAREENLTYDRVEGILKNQFRKKEISSLLTRIGIDEFSHRKGKGKFATTVCDIEGSTLLEVIDSHKQETIIKSLMKWSLEQRSVIEEVAVDMWGGFTKVVKEVFPNAKVVYDRFHVMKVINTELNKIRKQCKLTTTVLKIKDIKGLLMKNKDNLKAEEKNKLEKILNSSERLKTAYELKEAFRVIYETEQSPESASSQLELWINKASSLYNDSVKTIRNHLDGICNYFTHRTTNATMEGMNNKIKLIKRQAYGFTDFEHLSIRLFAAFSD